MASRVPQTIAAFNTYIRDTDDRQKAVVPPGPLVPKYFENYNWTALESGSWSSQRTAWETLYGKYSSPVTSTSIIKDQVHDFMKAFATFATPLLDKIEACGKATQEEEHIFHLVLGRHNPTHPTTPITENCNAAIEQMGGAMFEISCKSQSDQSRASIVKHANSVRYSYLITDTKPTSLPGPDGAGTTKDTSNRALFRPNFGTQNQGKWLIIYFQWYNSHYPQFAGPWSAAQVIPIG